MKKITVYSKQAKFQYIAHFNAFYEALNEDFNVSLKGHDLLKLESNKTKKFKFNKSDYVIFLFPSFNLVFLIFYLKFFNIKTIYWFHEPFNSYKDYQKGGNTVKWIFLFYLKNLYSRLVTFFSDHTFFPSEKSLSYYNKSNFLVKKKISLLPLFFCEHKHSIVIKKEISYIGSLNGDHNFMGFVNFVEKYSKSKNPQFSLNIKTKDTIPLNLLNKINNLNIKQTIKHGKMLTEDEINSAYRSTTFIWNAYNRSNQSGVLVNSLNFGCIPIINENTSYYDLVKDVSIDLESFNKIDRFSDDLLLQMMLNSKRLFIENFSTKKACDTIKSVIKNF